MGYNKYSPVKKGIIIVLNGIFVPVLLVTLVITIVFFAESGGDFKRLTEGKTYIESEALKEDLNQEAQGLTELIRFRELLETKEILDEKKMINVLEYSTASFLPGEKEHPLNYRLADLLNWASAYSEWRETGGIYSAETASDEVEPVTPTDFLIKSEELYQPEGYENIDDYVAMNNSNRQQCENALMEALNRLPQQVSQYQDFKAAYDVKKTNIIYEATNMVTGQKTSNGTIEDIKGKKVSIEDEFGDYIIKIGVDTSFPIKDSFFYTNINYNKFTPYLFPILLFLLSGLVIGSITFVWMTLLSGHSAKKEGITLLAIDRLPTEISLLIWGVISVLILSSILSYDLVYLHEYNAYSIGTGCFLLVVGYGLFLVGYLSLVRIIKARTFTKNSICYKLYHGFQSMIYNRETAGKVVGAFTIYLVINFIFSLNYWWGGTGFVAALVFNFYVGRLLYKDVVMRRKVLDGIKIISAGDLEYQLPIREVRGSNQELAEAVNKIGGGLHRAVEANMKNERMKTDLITNVSHDIKTPLTSIVNYVDLLKRENIKDEKIKGYIDILDNKSQRLKQLTEDLVEASKVSSGNITLELMNVDFNELLQQTIGEFEDKFKAKELELIINHPVEPVVIEADGRRIWRIIENLFNNIVKYAMPRTRVYVDLYTVDQTMRFSVKNVSEHALNINADELTERFIRGDVSRSTEGSGLGLSIAKELTRLQKGDFDIYLDGDLFKVTIVFALKNDMN